MRIVSPLLLALLVAAVPATAGAAPLRPAADFSVSAARPLAGDGSAKRLVAGRRPARRAYVRFALGAPQRPGTRLTLRLYPLRDAPAGLVLRHAADRPWSEARETFRTAPRTGPRAALTGPLRRHRWASIDVTRLATTAPAVSLELSTLGARTVLVASREAGATAPELVVTPAPGVPLAPKPVGPALGAAPPPPAPAGPAPSSATPCGVGARPAAWQHVVWIVMENHAYDEVVGAPSIASLAARCGLATNYTAVAHPSVPNYIALTSGDTQGITSTVSPAQQLLAPSIFSQLGTGWRTLAESMPAACALAGGGLYMPTHNPAAYYADLAPTCAAQNVPLTDTPDLSAAFTFIAPNSCNSMHDCPVATGDAWLGQLVPKLLDSPQYRAGATAIFVTWDEDDGSAAQHVATLVISPGTAPGTQDPTAYDHYSLLRTTEEMLGLAPLANAATATSMRGPFGL